MAKEFQLCHKQKVSYMFDREDSATTRQALEAQAEEKASKLQQEREKLTGNVEQLDAFEETYNTEHKEHEVIAKELGQIKAEFAAYERKDVKYREDIKHDKEKEKKLKDTLKKERAKIAKTSAAIEEHDTSLQRSQQDIEPLTAAVQREESKVEEIYESLKGETEALRDALEDKKKELAPLKEEANECRSKVEIIQAERDLMQQKQDSGRKQLEEAEKAIATMDEKLQQRQSDIAESTKEQAQIRKQLEKLGSEQDSLQSEETQVNEKLRSQRGLVQESRLASEELQSRGGVLQALLSAKKDRLPGIEDRLGSLGTIDDKYDVAISTACAGPLNNIVANDTATAEKAVEFLKKNNVGRATFIMLDKLEYLRDGMKPIETPEGAPRLFDLVKAKHAKYRPAFYMAMRDTLVAKDLEQATRLAYGSGKRFRVVTLEGQLIEASGTMSGGGNKAARGGMSKSTAEAVSSKDLAAMQSELSSLEGRCKAIRARKVEISKGLSTMKKRLSAAELTVKKAEMEVEALSTQKVEQQERMPELVKLAKVEPSKADAGALSKLDAELKSATKTLDAAAAPAQKLEAEIAKLQEQISGVGGKRLATQKALFEKASAKLDETSSSMTKCKVQKATAEKNKKKAVRAAEKAEQELADVAAHAEKIRGEFKDLEEEAFKVMAKYNEAQALLDEKTAKVQQIQKEYDQLKEQVAGVRAIEVDLTNQLEDVSKSIRDCKQREEAWDKKIAAVEQKYAQLADDTPDMAQTVSLDIVVEELGTYDRGDIGHDITRLEEAISTLKPNMGAIAEYRRREKEYMERVAELDAITETRDAARREYEDLRKQRYARSWHPALISLRPIYAAVAQAGRIHERVQQDNHEVERDVSDGDAWRRRGARAGGHSGPI